MYVSVLDDADIKGQATRSRIAKRSWNRRIRDRNDHIRLDAELLGHLEAEILPHVVDSLTHDYAVGASEVDELEDVDLLIAFYNLMRGYAVFIDAHQFSGSYVTEKRCADRVEGTGLRGNHVSVIERPD